jgi:hypothetical protein
VAPSRGNERLAHPPVLLPQAALVPPQWLAKAVSATDMALWHVLILMCFAAPIGTSLASAQYARVGPGGYALAIIIGLIVGGGCGWTVWITHRTVGDYIQRHSNAGGSLWYFRAFYSAKILWVAFAGFIGFWLSSVLLRIVF